MKKQKARISFDTYFLEMRARPQRTHERACPAGIEIVRVTQPPIHFYRYLFDTVGDPWGWWERKLQTDDQIATELHDPGFVLFVPYYAGVPAGMVELDSRKSPEIRLNYFGLMPEMIGKGIGGYLMDWTVDYVWNAGAARFWLNTCTRDSPQALAMYLRAGFVQYDQRSTVMEDPLASIRRNRS